MNRVPAALALLLAASPARADAPPFADELQRGLAERFAVHTARYIDLEDPRVRVAVAPTFVWIRDLSLSLPGAPWNDETPFLEAFDLVRTVWTQTNQPNVRALVVFTSFDVGPTTPFYVSLANDVSGLGQPIFDDTPGSSLDGLIWMGEIDALWREGPEYYEEAFIHEIAHRWGVYVDVDHPDLDAGQLRGRQDKHWSFFVDTDNSPMDGNDWRPEGTARSTWFLTPHRPHFSALDLYLMGLISPQEVAPFEVIRSHAGSEPSWVSVGPETIPAHRLDVTVRLTGVQAETVTIDDVVAANGPREPVVGPARWPIGVVLLSSGFNGTATRDERARFEATLADMTATYAGATGGGMTLRLQTTDSGTGDLAQVCAGDDDCNPARTDGCDPIRGVCAATCGSAASCRADEQCCDGWCAPADACEAPSPGADAGPADAESPTEAPDPDPVARAPDASSCRSTPSTSWAWLIGIGAAIRSRRRARSRDG